MKQLDMQTDDDPSIVDVDADRPRRLKSKIE